MRDDHVITNISGGSGTKIVIPDYALLYNDSDADGQTIAITGAITNVLGANSVTHASGNITFTDNNTNGESFTYTGSTASPAASDTGNVTVDRKSNRYYAGGTALVRFSSAAMAPTTPSTPMKGMMCSSAAPEMAVPEMIP